MKGCGWQDENLSRLHLIIYPLQNLEISTEILDYLYGAPVVLLSFRFCPKEKNKQNQNTPNEMGSHVS